jgi:hypothetical protein
LENISGSGGDNVLGEDGVGCSITASASAEAGFEAGTGPDAGAESRELGLYPEAKSKVHGWGIKSNLASRVKVDSGIGLSIVNVLESTLEWT